MPSRAVVREFSCLSTKLYPCILWETENSSRKCSRLTSRSSQTTLWIHQPSKLSKASNRSFTIDRKQLWLLEVLSKALIQEWARNGSPTCHKRSSYHRIASWRNGCTLSKWLDSGKYRLMVRSAWKSLLLADLIQASLVHGFYWMDLQLTSIAWSSFKRPMLTLSLNHQLKQSRLTPSASQLRTVPHAVIVEMLWS